MNILKREITVWINMIIPVFDVKDTQFVSGKSGNRETYTKLSSVYGETSQDILTNLKKSGAKCVYVADLDKIESVNDNSNFISKVNEVIPVLLDNGANCIEDILSNKDICSCSILATENMRSISDAYLIFEELAFENIIVSVDIKDNKLLIKNKDIKLDDIISLINTVKPAYTIILNISQVGTKGGNDDLIIRDIISRTPYTQHIIAGGLTNESIGAYNKMGIDNFLVGTILHDGSLLEEYKW